MSNEFYTQTVCEYNNQSFTASEICDVAKNQSRILYCILANIVVLILAFTPLAAIISIFSLVVSIAMLIFLVMLRNAMKKNIALTVILCVLMFIPLCGLLILLYHVTRATALLRTAGLKVGLMGVSSADLAVFKERNNFN